MPCFDAAAFLCWCRRFLSDFDIFTLFAALRYRFRPIFWCYWCFSLLFLRFWCRFFIFRFHITPRISFFSSAFDFFHSMIAAFSTFFAFIWFLPPHACFSFLLSLFFSLLSLSMLSLLFTFSLLCFHLRFIHFRLLLPRCRFNLFRYFRHLFAAIATCFSFLIRRALFQHCADTHMITSLPISAIAAQLPPLFDVAISSPLSDWLLITPLFFIFTFDYFTFYYFDYALFPPRFDVTFFLLIASHWFRFDALIFTPFSPDFSMLRLLRWFFDYATLILLTPADFAFIDWLPILTPFAMCHIFAMTLMIFCCRYLLIFIAFSFAFADAYAMIFFISDFDAIDFFHFFCRCRQRFDAWFSSLFLILIITPFSPLRFRHWCCRVTDFDCLSAWLRFLNTRWLLPPRHFILHTLLFAIIALIFCRHSLSFCQRWLRFLIFFAGEYAIWRCWCHAVTPIFFSLLITFHIFFRAAFFWCFHFHYYADLFRCWCHFAAPFSIIFILFSFDFIFEPLFSLFSFFRRHFRFFDIWWFLLFDFLRLLISLLLWCCQLFWCHFVATLIHDTPYSDYWWFLRWFHTDLRVFRHDAAASCRCRHYVDAWDAIFAIVGCWCFHSESFRVH